MGEKVLYWFKGLLFRIKENKKYLSFAILGIFLLLAYIALYLVTKIAVNNLSKARLVEASGTYITNLPINDPVQIKVADIKPYNLKDYMKVTPEVDLDVIRSSDDVVEVMPKDGRWQRGTKYVIEFNRPLFLTNKKLISRSLVSLKRISFTTAGDFQVIQTIRSGSVNPESGIEVRFNYRLKNPDTLKDKLTIVPELPLEVKKIEDLTNEKEVGMVYKITSTDMRYSESYQLTIDSTLLSELDEELGEPATLVAKTIENPYLPSINIRGGSYSYTLMVTQAGKDVRLPIEASKTDAVNIKLYEITPAQAINFLVYTQDDEESYWTRKYKETIDVTDSSLKFERDVLVSELSDPYNTGKLPSGIYLLRMSAEGGGDTRQVDVLVNVTNIGVVGVVGKYQNAFWVSTLDSGGILEGTNLRLYDLKDGANQTESIFSDGSGLAKFANNGKADLAVAFYRDDVAFVPLAAPGSQMRRTSSNNSYWQWYLEYPSNEVDDLGYLYTDRPIYKPGDTIHAKAIIRRDLDAQYELVPDTTYTLTLKKSSYGYSYGAKAVWEKQFSTNSFGTINADVDLSSEFKTGYYYLTLERADKQITSVAVYVDEYRKPLYDLSVTSDKDNLKGSDKLKFTITSKYSFGMPVVDREVEWSIYPRNIYYQNVNDDPYAKSNRDYYWEWWYGDYFYYGEAKMKGTAKLNADGEAVVEVDIDPAEFDYQKQVFTIEAHQTDQQITPERATTQVNYYPSSYKAMITKSNYSIDDPFVTLSFNDFADKPVSGVEVSLTSGYDEIGKGKTDNEGLVTFRFPKKQRSYSQVTFSWKDANGNEERLQTYVYVYYPSTDDEGKDILSIKDETADISMDQSYKYKDNVNLKVGNGGEKHLVVLGRESVVDAFVVDNDKETQFQITDDLMPNAYLFTYSFKDGSFVTGDREINPEHLQDYKKVNINISLDKNEYKPGDDVEMKIKTSDTDGNPVTGEVSVAVVDKAIYQLKKKAEEPIHPYFYKRRFSLTVFSESLSGIKFYDGGGGGGGGGPEAQVRSKFADTAYYKADIVTDASGNATVNFKLPDNITTWVVSTYAVDANTKVGEAEREFASTKDIFAIPIFPQFVTNGDNVYFRSLVANTTNDSRDVKASFAFGGNAPEKDPTKSLSIGGNDTVLSQWEYKVNESDAEKEAALLVAGDSNNILDGVTIKTPIKTQGITIDSRVSGIGAAKFTPTIMDGADSFKSQSNLHLHTNILGYVNDILVFQSGYPYGCVEQTMSRFYPTLLVKKYINYLSVQGSEPVADLDDKVQAGIERLQKFHHDDGGWGLWENDQSSAYYTSYVMNGLLDLQGSYEISQDMLTSGKQYLEKQIADSKLSDKEKIKVMLPLARMGSSEIKPDFIDVENLSDYDEQQLAEIAITYATLDFTGKEKIVDELKRRAVTVSDREVKWKEGNNLEHFAHENLSTALAIQALLLTEPNSELITKALNFLNTHRNRYVYGSTYTNTQVAKAFVEYVRHRGLNTSGSSVTVTQDGKTLFSGMVDETESTSKPISISLDKEVNISQNGSGVVLWEVVTNNIFPGQQQGRDSDMFKIERSYKNLSRDGDEIRVGDVVEVSLKVNNRSGDQNNLVIEDNLPAGFEAVNPKLDSEKSYGQQSYDPYSSERYSDHIVLFPYYFSSKSQETLKYIARAYLPGTYLANPATVSLMYYPAVPAFSSSNVVTIKE